MPPIDPFTARCELNTKIRWNRLARNSLAPEFESIGVFATPGTPLVQKYTAPRSVNDPYFDKSDQKFEGKDFDVRISRIKTNGIPELAQTLRHWLQDSPSRYIHIRSYNGATYRMQSVANDDLISTLKNARLIDVVERTAEPRTIVGKINNLLGA